MLLVKKVIVSVAACVLFPWTLSAQNTGQPVEIIGLHTWTRQMVKDSLAKHVPWSDTTLSTHACAAELLQLGFARTSSFIYPTHVLVSVVEPQDSAKVRNNPPITTTRPLPESWKRALARLVDSRGKFTNGVMDIGIKYYGTLLAGRRDSINDLMHAGGQSVPPALDSLWDFLQSATTDQDFQHARDILTNEQDSASRMLAVAVLANFSAKDAAWHTLMHTLRDRNDAPGPWMKAEHILKIWLTLGPKTVDWKPMTDDLRALMAGANLWALLTVMDILTKTNITPAVLGDVLRDNDVFAVGYANSQIQSVATTAKALLAIRGATASSASGKKRWINASELEGVLF